MNKLSVVLYAIGLVSLFFGCEQKPQVDNTKLTQGFWRATLTADDGAIIPFVFEVKQQGEANPKIHLINGEERILIDNITQEGNQFTIPMHIFDSKIIAKLEREKLSGEWIKYGYGKEYKVPFEATFNQKHRFTQSPKAEAQLGGRWEVTFEDDSIHALGIFEQKGDRLSGTFLTTIGDYRYLEGEVNGKTMNLSCFDGSHAFLFSAQLGEDGTLSGDFWSGKTYHVKWTAQKNDNYELPDPNRLTFLKEGYETIDFNFPNLQGDSVRLIDAKYKGKVVILQLFGSWCPNCMDETKFLAPFYTQNRDKGLEIIGLAYEKTEKFEVAKANVERMTKRIGVDYDLLVAGVSNKIEAGKRLPMLNHVMSFPTTIFIDKQGRVRRIHTGFSGPGTGKYYERFVEDFNLFVDKLLKEKADETHSNSPVS